ncbi:pyrroline-5-carboxylate reductase family protein [Vibrio hippocampi]|uniref:Pyrroline-5-carboxylate reductase n=1 Tax=Vibrio hippocampi TaxID=654686 RepID=A0ABM8ZMA6_9VIBR|nr:NAD(P)-binding domain-containing protein [Vibrio hippocampi]CAH0529421.1 Pyrroline-5-carboxylate reductase [Vibrio hippocampi]
MLKLGIIGVGELTEKIVLGLINANVPCEVYLSPRNQARSEQLAQQPSCTVMDSNQAVADAADIILLGVRPQHLSQLASEIVIEQHKTVVSLAAGIDVATLQQWFRVNSIHRMMTTYSAELNRATVVLTPTSSPVEQLFQPLGEMLVVESEHEFELATVGMCMNGWMYFFSASMQQWFVDQGMKPNQAKQLVLGAMADSAARGLAFPEQSLEALGESIATPGTYTAQGLEKLQAQEFSQPWTQAAADILERLKS